jgi:hypothetical protein
MNTAEHNMLALVFASHLSHLFITILREFLASRSERKK